MFIMEGRLRAKTQTPEQCPDSPVEEAQTPLLENMVIGVPPVFEGLTREIGQLVEQPLLGPRSEFPSRELGLLLERLGVLTG